MPNVSRPSFLTRMAVASAFGIALPVLAQGPAPTPNPAQPTPPINPPQAPIPPAGSPAAAPTPAGQPRPFKEMVKDAKEMDGYFKVFQKEDKTFIEIRPDQFDKPFYFSTVRTQGLGERFVISGLMGTRHVVYFKKIGSHVQLIAQNQRFPAKAGLAVTRPGQTSDSDS